jgi:phosphoribosylglycinamide formyltransferase-1
VIERALRFGFVVSSGGAAMNEVLKNDFVRSRTLVVVADHEGPAADHARSHDVETVIVDETEAMRFCERLQPILVEHEIDVVFSYYEQFYSEAFRAAFRDRILNFHPSLLPAFKGADGFGDTVAYPARFAGNTVELIADVMDEGKIVMQTVCPVDANAPLAQTRHRVFVQQCQALIQVARWFQDGRVQVDGHRVTIAGAEFNDAEFSPALDDPDASRWHSAYPDAP